MHSGGGVNGGLGIEVPNLQNAAAPCGRLRADCDASDCGSADKEGDGPIEMGPMDGAGIEMGERSVFEEGPHPNSATGAS